MAGLLLAPSLGLAQMEELVPIEDDEPTETAKPDEPKDSAPVILEEFEVDERDVVLSAARTRSTIQEAPGIITVITAQQIRQRGYRTVNDVLRSVPGFEGGRFEKNDWFNESVARGQPRTLLILVNGVPTNEPIRNNLSMDRKIPVDIIKRIEITSGPGGVLWGSNALLGIINIILKDASDLNGVEALVGGGHGPGAQEAIKGHVAYGDEWLDGKIRLYTSVDYYSDRGAELKVDAVKVLGALPEPAPDSKTLYEDRSDVTDFNSRDYFLSNTTNLQLWDQLTLEWFLEWEQDYRQITTGGAILRGTVDDGSGAKEVTDETLGNDSLQMVALNWRERFMGDRFGTSAKIYLVNHAVREEPFWAFPPRDLGDIQALDEGVEIALNIDRVLRFGGNLDFDWSLGHEHHLVFGAEIFQEQIRGATRKGKMRAPLLLPGLADPTATTPQEQRGIFSPTRCPPAGTHAVTVRDLNVDGVFSEGCEFEEVLLLDTNRTVGALYLSDEWKPSRKLAIQPGTRLQLSDAYDPVVLFSAAVVWNVVDKLFLKLNYAEGFRPPELQSTRINNHPISDVSFESGDDVQVERSRAVEGELNAVVLEDVGALDRIYLRGDYAYTVLTGIIRQVGGRFDNSGDRGIHSVEFLARADFQGDHELWFGGHFIEAEDSVFGPVRNFPNWVFMGGGRFTFIDKYLELSTLATFIGPQEDRNRAPDTGVEVLGFQVSDAVDTEVDLVDPYVLWRIGLRAPGIWEERLELAAFFYNALNPERTDPDFNFDDRTLARSQSRGGWSFFGHAQLRY